MFYYGNSMENLLKLELLEALLIKSWPKFMDQTKMLAFVLEHVRDSEFEIIKRQTSIPKTTQIKASSFEVSEDGFLIWIDFVVPKSKTSVAKGTMEIAISFDGKIKSHQILGNIFSN